MPPAPRPDLRMQFAPAAAQRWPSAVRGDSWTVSPGDLVLVIGESLPEATDVAIAALSYSPLQRRVASLLLPLGKMSDQKLGEHLDAGGTRAAGRRHQMHRALRLRPAFQDYF